MPLPPEKVSDYNRRYYLANKERLSQLRRKRYQEDADYRDTINSRATERKRRLALERYREGKGKRPVKHYADQHRYTIMVGDVEVAVIMYNISYVAEKLGRKAATIRAWETKGIIPSAMYRDAGGIDGNRLYTEFQVKKLKEAMDKAKKDFGERMTRTNIRKTSFPKLAKELWEQYPLGIDPEHIGEPYVRDTED